MSHGVPAYAVPALLQYVADHAAKGDPDAIKALAKTKPGKHVKREKGPDRKAARKLTKREETADLRAFVWERCGGTVTKDPETGAPIFLGVGRCEVTGHELGAAWEMHHVQGGGHRRSRQRPGNVLAVSFEVHRLIGRGDFDTLSRVAAAPTLDAEARREAQRRVDKVLEARGVPVRVEVR